MNKGIACVLLLAFTVNVLGVNAEGQYSRKLLSGGGETFLTLCAASLIDRRGLLSGSVEWPFLNGLHIDKDSLPQYP